MTDFIKVANVNEIPVGTSKMVEIEDMRIAIFNLAGTLYAIEDVCTHDGGPLAEGEVINECQVECPRHGARFDIRTGRAVSFPAFEATNSYQIKIQGDDVWVESPL